MGVYQRESGIERMAAMVSRQDIERIIKQRPEFVDLVFQRGYLVSTSDVNLSEIPFCRKWRREQFGSFFFWLHPNTDFFYETSNGKFFFIIGHAYNPVKMLYSERDILKDISVSFDKSNSAYQEAIDELTGIFLTGVIEETNIRFQSDAVSMFISFSGIVDNQLFLTSHCNIVACAAQLTRDPYVNELVDYRFYKYFGAGLPGDLSPYRELKRTQSNFEYCYDGNEIRFSRVFPCSKLAPASYADQIKKICTLLENNMNLIWLKWGEKAALGLTGGRDSTTALAGAHGLLSNIRTFSYVSCEGEQNDASAAEMIAEAVHVSHETYNISLSATEQAECEDVGTIIEFNMGSIGRLKDKEIQKRVYFFHHPVFQVEIKSWVDEIGRARLHKRYLKKEFPNKIKPRYLTTVYKPFGLKRNLVHKTDNVFSTYLNKYYSGVFDLIPWWDLIYWEYLWGANEALHLLNEHMLTAVVTIPFNNRILLKSMLSVDLKKRIKDSIQHDVIENLLPTINQTGIHVKDFGWDRKREIAERVYWEIQTKLPF